MGSGFSGTGIRNTFTADYNWYHMRGHCVSMEWYIKITLCTKTCELGEHLPVCFELRSEHNSGLVKVNYHFPLLFFVLGRIMLLCPLLCTDTRG